MTPAGAGSEGFSFSFDVTLTTEPRRADVIVVRRTADVEGGEAHTLLHLWPLLPSDTVIEYKSPVRPLRRGGLSKLLGYGAQYHSRESARLDSHGQLALVLVVASWTPTLDHELAVLGWSAAPLGGGYYRVDARPYALYVVVVDDVSEAEKDALLNVVGHRTMDTLESYQWVVQHTAESPEGRSMDKLEGFEELLKTVIARTPIALRLAGLKAEEQILALSDDVLATLPQSYIATLPAEARAEIERRLFTRH